MRSNKESVNGKKRRRKRDEERIEQRKNLGRPRRGKDGG
jgi:hypothetical protein